MWQLAFRPARKPILVDAQILVDDTDAVPIREGVHEPSVIAVAPSAVVTSDKELEGCLIRHSPGDRLAVGLAADRHRRKLREEKLQRDLQRARRLDSLARGGSMVSGLIELLLVFLWVLLSAGLTWLPERLLYTLGYLAIALVPTLLVILLGSGMLAGAGVVLRLWLVKGALRDAVEIPSSLPPISCPMEDTSPAMRDRVRRTTYFQQEVNSAYRDERTLGDLCLWSAYGSLVSGVLGFCALLINSDLSDPFALGALFAASPLLILPIAAPAGAWRWLGRKRLLRAAAREGITVTDPAESSWK